MAQQGKRERESVCRTEALRRAGVAARRPDPTMDGPYTCGHMAVGVDIAIWRVEDEGGEGQTCGIPRDMDRDAADTIARAQEGARMAGMAQDRVGEGLVTWEGQMRPGDMLAAAIAAGGSIRVDGTGARCEVPITGPAWVRIGRTMAMAKRLQRKAGASQQG